MRWNWRSNAAPTIPIRGNVANRGSANSTTQFKADLRVAEERSATADLGRRRADRRAGVRGLARDTRTHPPSAGQREALREQTARVLETLNLLGELTADDGFRDREQLAGAGRPLSHS